MYMKYVLLINSLLIYFLSDEETKNLVMEKKKSIEIVYIYYTIVQCEYGE